MAGDNKSKPPAAFPPASKLHADAFNVISWNVLARAYTRSSSYPYCEHTYLRWEARQKTTIKVLQHLNGDILCLQEVDEFKEFWLKHLQLSGYDFVYVPRGRGRTYTLSLDSVVSQVTDTSVEYRRRLTKKEIMEAKSHAMNGTKPLTPSDEKKAAKRKSDGCVIAWRRDRFELRPPYPLKTNATTAVMSTTPDDQKATPPATPAGGADDASKCVPVIVDYDDLAAFCQSASEHIRLLRHNVGMFVMLRPLSEKGESQPAAGQLLVANTHLYWNPMYDDVKLKQIGFLVKHLEYAMSLWNAAAAAAATAATTAARTSAPATAATDSKQSTAATAGVPSTSLVLCGDFNSMPETVVYGYLRRGQHTAGVASATSSPAITATGAAADAKSAPATGASGATPAVPVVALSRNRMLLDSDMGKVARMLRAVGVDAEFFDQHEYNVIHGTGSKEPVPTGAKDYNKKNLVNANASGDGDKKSVTKSPPAATNTVATAATGTAPGTAAGGDAKSAPAITIGSPNLIQRSDKKKPPSAAANTSASTAAGSSGSGKLTDAEVEDAHEALFRAAHEQKRIIITRSKLLVQRRGCPPFYLVSGRDSYESFAEIVAHFDVQFNDADFYQRCTICNAGFNSCTFDDVKASPDLPLGLRATGGLDDSGRALSFYRCVNPKCAQLYWWGSKSIENKKKFQKRFAEIHRQYVAAKQKRAEDKAKRAAMLRAKKNKNITKAVAKTGIDTASPVAAAAAAATTTTTTTNGSGTSGLAGLAAAAAAIASASTAAASATATATATATPTPPPALKKAADSWIPTLKPSSPVAKKVTPAREKKKKAAKAAAVSRGISTRAPVKDAKDDGTAAVDELDDDADDAEEEEDEAEAEKHRQIERFFAKVLNQHADGGGGGGGNNSTDEKTGDSSGVDPFGMNSDDDEDVIEERERRLKMMSELKIDSLLSGQLSHGLGLSSAYEPMGEPITNWTHKFVGCLDYIFYTAAKPNTGSGLRPLALRPLPTKAEVSKHVGFPSQHWPSDHVALGTTFVWASQAPATTTTPPTAAAPTPIATASATTNTSTLAAPIKK